MNMYIVKQQNPRYLMLLNVCVKGILRCIYSTWTVVVSLSEVKLSYLSRILKSAVQCSRL